MCVCVCVKRIVWEPQGKPTYETVVMLSTLACVTVSSHAITAAVTTVTTTAVVYVRSS